MDYRVMVTEDTENDLDSYIHYLLYTKKMSRPHGIC